MPPRLIPVVLLAASLAVVDANLAAKPSRPSSTTYVANMSAANEVPSNTSSGTGTAVFKLDDDRLTFTINVAGLTGAATAAHIHIGAANLSGPPIYQFSITKSESGTLATGGIDLKKNVSATVSGDSLKALLNKGNAYVNVHTTANPSGEIRGQIMKQ